MALPRRCMWAWKLSIRAASRSVVKPSSIVTVFGRMSSVPSAAGTSDSEVRILRLLPFRVEVDAHLDLAGDLFTRLRVVNVPVELGPGQQQFARIRPHHLALLADCPLHEGRRQTGRRGSAGLGLLEIRDRVMRDLAARERLGPDFNRAHPARLGDARRRDALVPDVLRHLRHREVVRLDDQIRLFLAERRREIPALTIGPLLGLRHVLRVALRRARVHPAHDRVELFVGERSVVLEFLDADAPIDLPRWHLALRHARLDRLGPRPRLRERHQRHRRHRVGPVARLALLLEDRRDVFRERRRFGGIGRSRPPPAASAPRSASRRRPRNTARIHAWLASCRVPSWLYSRVERSLSRRYWSSSTESRRRLRPTRHWPGHAACILPACRTSRSAQSSRPA